MTSKKSKKEMFSSKEELKEYVHSIHDFIRNSGAGYSMSAMKLFNMLWSLKLLEGKIHEFGLPKECDWEYLRKKFEDKKNNQFDQNIYTAVNNIKDRVINNNEGKNPLKQFLEDMYDNIDDIDENGKNKELQLIRNKIADKLDEINGGSEKQKIINNLSFFIYHEIQNGLTNNILRKLFKLVDNLPIGTVNVHTNKIESFDLKGKIYEYFIGRDDTAISELGAYFTDRYLTNLCFDIIKPNIVDGIVPTMTDPFGGSGGFTIKYVDYINNNFKVDWKYKDNFKNVYHYDMSEDVVKIAGVEFYSLTECFPEKGVNFKKTNTFTEEFQQKFKYLLTNPPYGGDKGSKTFEIENNLSIIDKNKILITEVINELCEIYDITDKDDIKKFTNELEKYGKFNNKIEMINTLIPDKQIEDIDKFYKEIDSIYKEFCLKKKLNYEDNKDLYYKYSRLIMQNIKNKKINDNNLSKLKEQKVNYNTCSQFIQNYSQKLLHEYNVFIRQESIKRIDEELKTETDNSKIIGLKKIKDKYKKELEVKYNKITTVPSDETGFNDKEACSFILLMALLENEGTCVAVLKDGVFSDNKYSDIRCYLVNNFNITDIIEVDNPEKYKSFENTNVTTQIIIFKNNGRTKKIKFHKINIEIYKDNNYAYDIINGTEIIEYKDKIKSFGLKFINKVSYEQLSNIKLNYNSKFEPKLDFNYNLKSNNYANYTPNCPNGYELVKLGNICNIVDGYAFKSDEFKTNGNRLIQISNINNGFINITDNDKFIAPNDKYNKNIAINGDLLLGMTGNIQNKFGYYINKETCYLNQRVCGFRDFENELYKIYFHSYWVYSNIGKILQKSSNGTNQKNLSKEDLLNINIPFPKDINKLKKPLDKLYNYHQQITHDTELIPQKEQHIMDLINKLTSEGKKGVDYDEHKLGDICEFKSGKFNTKDMNNNGNIPFYNATINSIGFHDNYCFDDEKYVLLIKSGNVSASGLGSVIITTGKSACVSDMVQIKSTINIDYLYYILKINKDKLRKTSNNSVGLGHLKMSDVKNMIIKILKPSIMNKHKLEELFDEVDKLKQSLETNKKTYQELLKELFKDFKNDEEEVPEDENDDETEEEPEEEPEFEIIKYNNTEYILEDNIMYKIKEENGVIMKGSKVGTWNNGKIIKGIKKGKLTDKKIDA